MRSRTELAKWCREERERCLRDLNDALAEFDSGYPVALKIEVLRMRIDHCERAFDGVPVTDREKQEAATRIFEALGRDYAIRNPGARADSLG